MALEWLKKLFGGGKKEEGEMQAQAPQGEQQPADMASGEEQSGGQESGGEKQW